MTGISVKTQDPASMIVLRNTRGALVGKTFKASDAPEGFEEIKGDPGLRWFPMAVQLKDLDHLHRSLMAASRLKDAAIIRGKLVRDLTPEEEKRGIYRRLVDGGFDNGLWQPAARSWVGLDLDGSEPPAAGWDALSAALPAPFAGVSFVWNQTASSGLKSGLRVRLWFMLSDPVEDGSLRRFVKGVPPWMKLDASLFTANHLHYVASPEFSGLSDPCGADGRWGLHRTGVDVVDAKQLLLLRPEDSDPHSIGMVLEGLPEPSLAEIEQRVEACRKQVARPGTARHDHAIGVACELIGVGMEPELVALEAEETIRRQGRDPARGEGWQIVLHAVRKLKAGRMTTSRPPMSSVLTAADTADEAKAMVYPADPLDAAQEAAVETSGEDICTEAPATLFGSNDWLNAGLYREKFYPDDGFIRWAEQDWEWKGTHWRKLENDEVLLQRLQRHTNLKTQRAGATMRSFRSLMGKEGLSPPCTMDGKPLLGLLPFRNGILPIEDWILDPDTPLLEHSPTRFLTCALDYEYDPKAACPRFRRFLNELWPDHPDQQRELQKLFGYLLLQDNRFHKVFLFLGVKRSGKGTIFNLIKQLVGEGNCCSPSSSSLADAFGLDPLIGKSVALIGEMNDKSAVPDVAVDRIKSISGSDSLPVNRKNKGEMHIPLPVRFLISCNRLPTFLDPSGALSARLVIFTMWESFYGKEDTTLGLKLSAELPGIAQFALEGLRMLLLEDGGFKAPASSNRVAESYKAMQAPTAEFFASCMEPGIAEDWVSIKDMYVAYRAWASEQGHKPISHSRLTVELGHQWPGVMDVSKVRRLGGEHGRERVRSHLRFTADGAELLKSAGVFKDAPQ
jgi:P4 family phage/plasmid primase-like protien